MSGKKYEGLLKLCFEVRESDVKRKKMDPVFLTVAILHENPYAFEVRLCYAEAHSEILSNFYDGAFYENS